MINLKNVYLNYPNYTSDGRYIKNVFFNYKKKIIKDYKILKNINLTINKGEKLGIVGNNGSGKSSLLKVLSGLLPATSGTVQIEKNTLAILNIAAGLEDYLDAKDNIFSLNLINDIKPNLNELDIQNILKFAELEKYSKQPLKTFSDGMKLRLSFSLYTYQTPKCLILDEWLSVGDKNFKEKCVKKLNDIISSSEIFIIASHDEDLINRVCNRVIRLNDGMIEQ